MAGRLAAGFRGEGDAAAFGRTAVATAKFWAADAGHRVAHTAVHVHGGLGIDMSYPVHRYFVAAKHHEFALGGATAQLRRIGAADLAGWLSPGRAPQRTSSAIRSRWRGSVLTENVVRTVCFHRWISSAILAQGPTRATSSTSLVGTAAMALFLSPAR